MRLFFTKTPRFVTWLFPNRIWAFSRTNNKVYLTFDDGPIPEVTPWVLKQLKTFNCKATFFCIGENIKKHPKIFQEIIKEGHQFGNHTYNHLKGINTNTDNYLKNMQLFDDELLLLYPKVPKTNLFRPPYGRLKAKQAKQIQKKGKKIVMWDVLSYDWDASVSREQCLNNVLNNIENGSIVVFHDSLKAKKNLEFVLPKVLNHLNKNNWKSEVISV